MKELGAIKLQVSQLIVRVEMLELGLRKVLPLGSVKSSFPAEC